MSGTSLSGDYGDEVKHSLKAVHDMAYSVEMTDDLYTLLRDEGYAESTQYILAVAGIMRPAVFYLQAGNDMLVRMQIKAFMRQMSVFRLIYEAACDHGMALLCRLSEAEAELIRPARDAKDVSGYRAAWTILQSLDVEDISDEDRTFLRGRILTALLKHDYEATRGLENVTEQDLTDFGSPMTSEP